MCYLYDEVLWESIVNFLGWFENGLIVGKGDRFGVIMLVMGWD